MFVFKEIKYKTVLCVFPQISSYSLLSFFRKVVRKLRISFYYYYSHERSRRENNLTTN